MLTRVAVIGICRDLKKSIATVGQRQELLSEIGQITTSVETINLIDEGQAAVLLMVATDETLVLPKARREALFAGGK